MYAESFTIDTRSTPSEAAACLSRFVQDFWTFRTMDPRLDFRGQVSAEGFRLRRIAGTWVLSAVVAWGRLDPSSGGTRISVTVRPHWTAYLIQAYVTVMLGALSLLMLPGSLLMAAGLVVLLVAGLIWGRVLFRAEAERIHRLMASRFPAEPSPPPLARSSTDAQAIERTWRQRRRGVTRLVCLGIGTYLVAMIFRTTDNLAVRSLTGVGFLLALAQGIQLVLFRCPRCGERWDSGRGRCPACGLVSGDSWRVG